VPLLVKKQKNDFKGGERPSQGSRPERRRGDRLVGGEVEQTFDREKDKGSLKKKRVEGGESICGEPPGGLLKMGGGGSGKPKLQKEVRAINTRDH